MNSAEFKASILNGNEDPIAAMKRLNLIKAQQEYANSKVDRKIYIGNIPTNQDTAELVATLN